jgi:hypothetical protein
MKKSTRLVLLLMLSISAATASLWAQPGGNGRGPSDPAQRAEMQTARMKEELGLSAKQAEKVKAINEKYANKMREMRAANQDGDRQAMRESMSALRQEQAEELQTVLTAEQFEKWQQMQSRQQNGRPGNGGPPPPGRSDEGAPKGNQ